MTLKLRPKLDLSLNRGNCIALLVLIALGMTVLFATIFFRVPKNGGNNLNSPQNAEIRELINPNTASVGSLTRLRGIGKTRALKILAYRKKYGKNCFKKLSDLCKVKGLGKVSVLKLAPNLTLENDLAAQ